MKEILMSKWGRRGQVIAVALLALAVMLGSIGQVPFHPDENYWIITSPYGEFFINGDFQHEAWDEAFVTLDQPPLARYIINAGWRAGGIKEVGFHVLWDFFLDEATNIERGAKPGPEVLWWSRLPMALLGALSAVLVFLLTVQAAGWGAGWAALGLFLGNAYIRRSLSRAMSEAPLLAFTMLAAGASFLALRAWRKNTSAAKEMSALNKPFGWFLLTGVMAGLAGASKINGLALAGSGAALAVLAAFVDKSTLSRNLRLSFAMRTVALLALICLLVFVLLNPFLYSDPLGRMVKIYKFRLMEMDIQIGQFPQYVIPQGLARLPLMGQRNFGTYFALPEVLWPLVLLLSLWGVWQLGKLGWGWLRGKAMTGEGGAASLVLLVLPLPLIIVALTTPLDWDRYYLLPVVFGQILFVVGTIDLACRLPFFRRN